MSYVKTYARILGWTFVAVGVVGFFLTGFGGFFGMDGETLILFGVNPAHNLVHLILGVTYLIGARASEAGARAVVLVLSSAYLLVGVLGLILIDTSANIWPSTRPTTSSIWRWALSASELWPPRPDGGYGRRKPDSTGWRERGWGTGGTHPLSIPPCN